MICELHIDISVRILGEFLSLKGFIHLDSAICCTKREKYLQLLKLVQISHKIGLSAVTQKWLALRRIKALSVNILVNTVNVAVEFNPLFQSLQHLSIHFGSRHSDSEPDEWLTRISGNCPRLQSIQFLCFEHICEYDCSLTYFLSQCCELKHFLAFHILFPTSLWKELHEQNISFLCITPWRMHTREIANLTGPLPNADLNFCKHASEARGTFEENCIWHNTGILEVNNFVLEFFPEKRVMSACYSDLCRGSHVSMLSGTFRGLELIQLRSCIDMDVRTFTAILQLPFVSFIDLYHNHTITGLAPNVEALGNCISNLQLCSFSALTNNAVKRIKNMLHPRASLNCQDMPQLPKGEFDKGLRIIYVARKV